MNPRVSSQQILSKAMRITVTQLLLAVLCYGLSFGRGANAQEILNRGITLQVESTDVRNILSSIAKQANVKFVYSSNTIQASRKVSLAARNEKLSKVLNELLTPLQVSYEVVGNRILLRKTPADQSSLAPLNPATFSVETADQTVAGTVLDEKGAALPGVSVVLKGSTRGTTTDPAGKYRLSVPDGNATLVFSFVGYQTQEVAVGTRSVIDITLQSDDKSLNEVVVVGYGTVKKSDLTGSVAKVGEAAIKATPIVSLDRAMQGRAAGVLVTQNSARPGGTSTIRIRGTGSVNASNDPLYVIDGFPTGNLNSINSDDIESIEILKDASATAIYGSRGANGVVLVTTKRGRAGKTFVSYDGYYGVQSVRRQIPMLNAREYAEFINEARLNGGTTPYFDGSAPDRPLPSALGEGTNWQNEIFREAPIQNHQLLFSGGSEKSRFAVSAGYYDQQGIIINSNFKRYTLRANLDNEISSRVKLGVTLLGAYTTSQSNRTEQDGNQGGTVTSSALNAPPTFSAYAPDGSYTRILGSVLNGPGFDNPVAIAREITDQSNLIRVLANTNLDFKIMEGLTFRTTFGADLQGAKGNYYATRKTFLGESSNGLATVSNSQSINWLNENTLNFNRTLNTRHTIGALLGYTIQGTTVENAQANGRTFNDDFALYNNLGAGSTLVAPSSGASDWRLISYIARVNYNLADRYLFTLTARRDGSSRFGENNKFGFFPSGAFAWKVLNESFAQNQKLFTDLKFRVSYGLSGNQEIGNYQHYANVRSETYVLGGTLFTGNYIGNITNPDLRWEKSAQFDAGVDFSLLSNRIQLTADYYIKTNSDLLFNVNIPTTSGFNSALQNIGKVQNRGVELGLNTINVDRGGFRWNSEFNISFNRNEILSLEGRNEFTTGSDVVLYAAAFNPILLRVGSPLGTFYGRVTDGIFQNQAEVDASAQKTAKPGDIRYRDLNNDGQINDNDRAIIGNANPKFFGGLNNTFTFKGLELNIFLQGNYGNDLLNFGRFDYLNLTSSNNNTKEVLDRWTPTNPSNTIPRANSAGGSRILSTFQVEDGSYLRVKNLSLGYNLPAALVKRLYLSGAKVYVLGQNLFTFTKYTGYDPEVNRYGSSSISQGIDYGGYPAARTVTVGLNLKF
ncbi:TonB-dependent receptor [Fibrisoma montanum]|nr:TonB-dependent receptor [Fibrisoma montanum]